MIFRGGSYGQWRSEKIVKVKVQEENLYLKRLQNFRNFVSLKKFWSSKKFRKVF